MRSSNGWIKPCARSLKRRILSLVRAICRADPAFFGRLLLSGVVRQPWNELHHWLLRRRAQKTSRPLAAREGALDVVLAPRGAAKSSLVSLIFPLHALLHAQEDYIVLISATQRQAAQRLANLRAELLSNPLLRWLYPAAVRHVARRSATSLEANSVRIDAFGAGAEIRGISHRAQRPTWIILDDVERGDTVHSAVARDRLALWFEQVVQNLGSPATHIDIVGTLLHRDSLPMRLARRPDVFFRRFASIFSEADAADLWDQWRALYHDLHDPQRLETARAFFLEHQSAMLAGSRVLWPERENYYTLVTLRERLGRAAFDQEKQNLAVALPGAVFDSARLRRFDLAEHELHADPARFAPGSSATDALAPTLPLDDLRVFGFLDPALGGESGDFAAIATVGLDPLGYLYLLDLDLRRARPSEQISAVFDLHARWRYEAFGVEINAFQRLLLEPFEQERARRRAAGRPWDLPLIERRHNADKQSRILALEPLISSQWLLFNRELAPDFIGQLEQFPNARHDDGPDALAAAVTLARKTPTLSLHPIATKRPTQSTVRNY